MRPWQNQCEGLRSSRFRRRYDVWERRKDVFLTTNTFSRPGPCLHYSFSGYINLEALLLFHRTLRILTPGSSDSTCQGDLSVIAAHCFMGKSIGPYPLPTRTIAPSRRSPRTSERWHGLSPYLKSSSVRARVDRACSPNKVKRAGHRCNLAQGSIRSGRTCGREPSSSLAARATPSLRRNATRATFPC
jgi:hypothetical protein